MSQITRVQLFKLDPILNDRIEIRVSFSNDRHFSARICDDKNPVMIANGFRQIADLIENDPVINNWSVKK